MAPNPFPPTLAPIQLADRGVRLGAALIDGIIVGICASLVTFGLFFVVDLSPFIWGPISSIIGYGIFLAINSSQLKATGQTIGKKMLGIRIANPDGSQPAYEQLAFKRYLVYLLGVIPFIGGLIALIDVLCIFRDNRRCLHDDFANTIVVKA